MKNVIREKEKANQIPQKSHTSPNVTKNVIREKKKSHASPGVEIVQLRTNRNSRYDGMWQYHQVQQCR